MVRKHETFINWQNSTYKTLVDAYEAKVREYNDMRYQTFEPELPGVEDETRKLEFNPLLNRSLEKRELKRLAINMLAEPFGITVYKNHYGGNKLFPSLTGNLDEKASYAKFFEQCFDWEIMAYVFYPYYYGATSDWKDLFKQSNGTDPIFQAFLQSGMARMVVPVRPGFEDAVAYFLETGEIWKGNQLAIDRDDDLYLSIAEELQQTEGKVEKEWETRVPTDLTIVQANAAPLDENGLPCCSNEDEQDNVGYGSSRMYLEGESPA